MNYVGWIITGIVCLLVIVAYLMLKNSPAGKALNGLFGDLETAFEAVGDQLKKCAQDGFLSASCPWGFVIIGAVILYLVGRIIVALGFRPLLRNANSSEFNRAFQRDFTSEDLRAIRDQALKDAETWIEQKGGSYTQEQQMDIADALTKARGILNIQKELRLQQKSIGDSATNASEARDRYKPGTVEREAFDDFAEDNKMEFAE